MSPHIRNVSVIAHIDHGKSTLADRLLEATGTIERRKMKEQVLDSMEIERERGITIKMQPVRMVVWSDYILNLIDTPGHIDFSYEVSRSLKAVEGALLLVDSTQGVQAQTLSTLGMAKELGLTIIPVLSKVDSPLARIDEVGDEIVALLNCTKEDIVQTSGKTGQGVAELLEVIIARVPPPSRPGTDLLPRVQALVFDFEYSNHQGVIVYVRVMSGMISKKDKLAFQVAGEPFTALDVGVFSPGMLSKEPLKAGEIGYIVTGIKRPGVATVGDTIIQSGSDTPALSGYQKPSPVVWASLFPESQDGFTALRQALLRLLLSDSSLSFEEESSPTLGRGFRSGFLGLLHLEIITERLKREFNLNLIITAPTVYTEVEHENGKKEIIYSPSKFPEYGAPVSVREPWVAATIITPITYQSTVLQLLYEHEAEVGTIENFGDGRLTISAAMPLRELMRNFFDTLKSVSSGFASLSYTIGAMRAGDVVRVDILVADEVVPAFSKIVSRRRVEEESKQTVEKLYNVLPRQLFTTKIQARALGRIISSKTLSALKKDVTGHLYGGDITRKRKLWEKQKKGKKKMKERGRVNIPHDVFLKMVKGE